MAAIDVRLGPPNRVAGRVGGIFNDESVAKYVASVTVDAADDPDAYLARCDVIHLDTKKPSNDGDIYVFLELDHFGPIRIHCQHISETMA